MSDWKSFHLFCGMGGDALGFKRAGWDVVGAIDGDQATCDDFERLVGVRPICGDVTDMVPEDVRAACDDRRPDVVITSPPCKGNSACLPESVSQTAHYQELNSLSQLGIWLTLEAWEAPPPIILLENVKRITSRSREWLDDCIAILREYGYAVEETTHDCGELGGLAQHRERYMLIARHMEQVPEFVYEPPSQRVKGVGEVLGELPVPLPDSPAGGPMHRLPRLSPMNWLRLATIPAGGDWRDLPAEVGVCDGYRGRYGIVHSGDPSPTVRANHEPRLAPASWADPRVTCAPRATAYGVRGWGDASRCVVGHACHDNSGVSVADPRVAAQTDPEKHRREGSLGVTDWRDASDCLIGHASIHNWPMSTSDPRISYEPRADSYGIGEWSAPSKTIRGVSKYMNAETSAADPRVAEATHILGEVDGTPALYGPELDLDSYQSADPVPVILARDGTWHRPLTTLELAVLQGFPARHDGGWLELGGKNKSDWRERIGNAIPPPTAEAIARTCAASLEAAAEGEFLMSAHPVWVDEPREVTA